MQFMSKRVIIINRHVYFPLYCMWRSLCLIVPLRIKKMFKCIIFLTDWNISSHHFFWIIAIFINLIRKSIYFTNILYLEFNSFFPTSHFCPIFHRKTTEIRLGYYSKFKRIYFVKQTITIFYVLIINNCIIVWACNSGRICTSQKNVSYT